MGRKKAYLNAVVSGYRMVYRPLAAILLEGFSLAKAATEPGASK